MFVHAGQVVLLSFLTSEPRGPFPPCPYAFADYGMKDAPYPGSRTVVTAEVNARGLQGSVT